MCHNIGLEHEGEVAEKPDFLFPGGLTPDFSGGVPPPGEHD